MPKRTAINSILIIGAGRIVSRHLFNRCVGMMDARL
jgi:hypothetical protein